MPPSSDSKDSSKEFSIILSHLKEIKGITTKVELLDQNQKYLKEGQDKIEKDVENLFENKASKTEIKTVSDALGEHQRGHGMWSLGIVLAIISGAFAIIISLMQRGT